MLHGAKVFSAGYVRKNEVQILLGVELDAARIDDRAVNFTISLKKGFASFSFPTNVIVLVHTSTWNADRILFPMYESFMYLQRYPYLLLSCICKKRKHNKNMRTCFK